ncbi:alpha/beta hydrolase (plasmid) [Tistrella mobilis]|uniref:alpha/beta hydrolase n=1 Tax=Tistrella mobilis TaxID=171437 RepID=UPI0035574C58
MTDDAGLRGIRTLILDAGPHASTSGRLLRRLAVEAGDAKVLRLAGTHSEMLSRVCRMVAAAPGVVVCGHNLGAALALHLADHPVARAVGGLLLLAPADVEQRPGLEDHGPLPRGPLPFPTIVAARPGDPWMDAARLKRLALCWCAERVELGGDDDRPVLRRLLRRLLLRVRVERDGPVTSGRPPLMAEDGPPALGWLM